MIPILKEIDGQANGPKGMDLNEIRRDAVSKVTIRKQRGKTNSEEKIKRPSPSSAPVWGRSGTRVQVLRQTALSWAQVLGHQLCQEGIRVVTGRNDCRGVDQHEQPCGHPVILFLQTPEESTELLGLPSSPAGLPEPAL